MSRCPGQCGLAYLVAQALGGDNSDLIADALVGLEVEGQARVVALDAVFDLSVRLKARRGILID